MSLYGCEVKYCQPIGGKHQSVGGGNIFEELTISSEF